MDRSVLDVQQSQPIEAVTCGWLSVVVVVSLGAQWAVGAWWIDGVASLAIVWLLVKEGSVAWSNKGCGCGGYPNRSWADRSFGAARSPRLFSQNLSNPA